MTTDELLQKLPCKIGRNPVRSDDGEILFYIEDRKEGISTGWLTIHNEGFSWMVMYGNKIEGSVCLNPDSSNPPYNNAIVYGETYKETLQKMYDWLVENNFIKK